MIEESVKQKTIEKILSSQEFADNKIKRELLEYLYQAEKQGHSVKEITIAREFFDRHISSDFANDSYVRNFIYKLRKKLDSYYRNEGKDEKVRLIIPKGRYHVEFIDKNSQKLKAKQYGQYKYILAIPLILIFIFVLFWEVTVKSKYVPIHPVTKHLFWGDFIKSEIKTGLVIGDIVLYSEYDSELQKWRTILDPDVDTVEDFTSFVQEHPERNVSLSNVTRIHMSTVPNLMKILPIFYSVRNQIFFEWSAELSWDDLRKNNIIYIGNVRSLQILKNLYNDKTIKVQHPEIIFLTDLSGDTLETYRNVVTQEYSETYAIISKFPGPSNNIILLLLGTDYPSRIFLIDRLSETTFLEELDQKLMEKFGKYIQYFEALIKVSGYFRIGFKHEILYLNNLEQK
jgi:DNA-dependent RNA polymerase auxiliary subunit epsilon